MTAVTIWAGYGLDRAAMVSIISMSLICCMLCNGLNHSENRATQLAIVKQYFSSVAIHDYQGCAQFRAGFRELDVEHILHDHILYP